ncbi:MAG: hypothetical protein ACWGNI_00375 [Desulfobacterales bacterium]
MTYSVGNNVTSDNLGVVEAMDVKSALKSAKKLIGSNDRVIGRPRYFNADPRKDAAIECISLPNYTHWDLCVREI